MLETAIEHGLHCGLELGKIQHGKTAEDHHDCEGSRSTATTKQHHDYHSDGADAAVKRGVRKLVQHDRGPRMRDCARVRHRTDFAPIVGGFCLWHVSLHLLSRGSSSSFSSTVEWLVACMVLVMVI